jgi:SpoVK/Ycf46/Vps4 family AAA+-type ATPase
MQEDGIITVVGGPDIVRPQLGWDDLCLPRGMGEDIRVASETFFKSKAKYRKFGLAYRRGFLFSGPPGCGKTQTAKVIASTIREATCIAYTMRDSPREAENLQEAFSNAESLAPAIFILEDLDKIGSKVPISMVLNLLDGLETPRGVLVIASTNEPEKLDPALLLRPSRFDRVWSFPLPGEEQRRSFLAKKSGGAFAREVIDEVAKLSQGFSMAYVQEILASAVAYAIRDAREPAEQDLIEAVTVLRKQIKESRSAVPRIGQPNEGLGFRIPVET